MTALVPMRSGSKGIPDKNIKDFLGKPLFYWNIKALLDAGAEVWVSTDSQRYAGVVKEYFGRKVNIFYRSSETANDTATTWDVVKEFIDKRKLPDSEILLVCQVTSPYLKSSDVKASVALLQKDGSFRTVGTTKRYYYDGDEPVCHIFPHRPRQQEDGIYVENGCLYGAKISWMKHFNTYHNQYTVNIEQPHAWEIDNMGDWLKGEWEVTHE